MSTEFIKNKIDPKIVAQIEAQVKANPSEFPVNKLVKVGVETQENNQVNVEILKPDSKPNHENNPQQISKATDKTMFPLDIAQESLHLSELRKEQEARVEAHHQNSDADLIKLNQISHNRVLSRIEIRKAVMGTDLNKVQTLIETYIKNFRSFDINDIGKGTPPGTTIMHYAANSKENNATIIAYLVAYEKANMNISTKEQKDNQKDKTPLYYLKLQPKKYERYQAELFIYQNEKMQKCLAQLYQMTEKPLADFRTQWNYFKNEFLNILSKDKFVEIATQLLHYATKSHVKNIDVMVYLRLAENADMDRLPSQGTVPPNQDLDFSTTAETELKKNPEKFSEFNKIMAQEKKIAFHQLAKDTQLNNLAAFQYAYASFERKFGTLDINRELEGTLSLMHAATFPFNDTNPLNIDIILYLELRKNGDMQAPSKMGTPISNLEASGYLELYQERKKEMLDITLRYQHLLSITEVEDFKETLELFMMDFQQELQGDEHHKFIEALATCAKETGKVWGKWLESKR